MGETAVAADASRRKRKRPVYTKWSKVFLAHLSQTSNVAASARQAGISSSAAYEAKRTRPEFNRQWRQSLCEGYELLEMELLHRLRMGQLKGADGKMPARLYDNSIAFRLLVAHRGEAAKQRAVRDNEDADAILASIDAKLDRMRKTQLAADGVDLTDGDPYDDEE